MNPYLKIEKVSKRFENHLAVDEVSLAVEKGQIFGLLGPNGAGKTTLIRMITGIYLPDSGSITVDGVPWTREHVSRMGYMPEERGLYKKTKVLEQITYLLRLKGMDKKTAKQTGMEWLERLGLGGWADKLTTDLSKGMQQKVQFIATVAHEPDLLILDEPVSGLDPVNAKVMEEEILRLKKMGKTILFSTHRLEQVEELCDSLALIHKGKVILENTLPEVRKQFQRNHFRLEFEGIPDFIDEWPEIRILEKRAHHLIFETTGNTSRNSILEKLAQSNLIINKFEKTVPRLNDIFIELVGEPRVFNPEQ